MKNEKEITLTLDIFEGPLALLYHLVQKCEIDIYELFLKNITKQYFVYFDENQSAFDSCADFISTTASLLCLKSQKLLPKHEKVENLNEVPLEEDPHFEILHHLIDYCRFKQAAKGLVSREQEQASLFPRGTDDATEKKKSRGLQNLTLDDLASFFKHISAKAHRGIIHREELSVSDKIQALRYQITDMTLFEELFLESMTRHELIVTFLAILELMKNGEIIIAKDESEEKIIVRKVNHDS